MRAEELELEEERRLTELDRAEELAEARNDLLAFTQYTKPDYEVNWHHRVKCQKLNQFLFGDLRFLMLFEPPRVGKTELVSKRLPAFIHGRFPHARIQAATYNADLAAEMCSGVQEIMDTPRYKLVFPKIHISPPNGKTILTRNSEEHELGMLLGRDQILSKVDENGLQLGDYRAQGVGGSFSGFGSHFTIIDDPVKNRQDADSPAFRKSLQGFYTSTLRTRLEGSKGKILLTLTRWHESDLAGFILDLMKANPKIYDQWEVLSFPAIREDYLNPLDPRKLGESLWQSKFPESEYAAIKAGDERDWAALYQQRPAPVEGNIIKREWMENRQYKVAPEQYDEKAIFVDLTFKPGESSDYTVVECWGRNGTDIYLIDQIRDRMGFSDQLEAIRTMKARHPDAIAIEIEEAANGAAVIQTLTQEFMGVIPVKPRTSKEARLHVVSPLWKAQNVWLPHPSIAPWVEVNKLEYLGFPSAKHDDCVDVMTMALTRLGRIGNSLSRLEALSRL